MALAIGGAGAAEIAPRERPAYVHRARLIDRLLQSTPASLVTVTAPAGYSKSTCLAEWAEADERPFAWITADRWHNDPALLVSSVVEALDEIEPVPPDVLMALANPSPSIANAVMPRLAEAVGGRSPFVLVFDDLQSLDSEEAFDVIEVVIEHLPAGAQVALGSRTEPPLPLGRHRANRRLFELGRADLSLTRAESRELLSALGLDLTDAQAEDLHERTEGWPAALYLAGLALLGQDDLDRAVDSFAGDDRFVVDYVRDEFLALSDEATLRFLTRTAVLGELDGASCDAVLRRTGSAVVLQGLARSNALIVPLDRRDGGYRYHQLFAELLLSELRRREPELEPGLHWRASEHYADAGDMERAIDHAIAAGEYEQAGELMWNVFPELSGRGRIATVESWLERVGDGPISESSSLSLVAAHRSLARGDGVRAAHHRRTATAAANDEELERIEPDLLLIDATLEMNGIAAMGRDAERASRLLSAEAPWQAPAHLYGGVAEQLAGRPDAARPWLQEAARRGAVASVIIQVLGLTQLALMADEAGDPHEASRLAAHAHEQVERCGLVELHAVIPVHAVFAMVLADEGRVDRARAEVQEVRRMIGELTAFPSWFEAETRIALTRACTRLGDLAAAKAFAAEAEGFIEPDAPVLRSWLDQALAGLPGGAPAVNGDADLLTDAELRILQYLPSHLTFKEIGERTHVSQNTVKTQAQAIYRKLGASSRAEAVERARQVGLLREDPLPAH